MVCSTGPIQFDKIQWYILILTASYLILELMIYIYIYLTDINDEMDFSGYDENHRCFDACDKKVLGKFKDEVDGKNDWIYRAAS